MNAIESIIENVLTQEAAVKAKKEQQEAAKEAAAIQSSLDRLRQAMGEEVWELISSYRQNRIVGMGNYLVHQFQNMDSLRLDDISAIVPPAEDMYRLVQYEVNSIRHDGIEKALTAARRQWSHRHYQKMEREDKENRVRVATAMHQLRNQYFEGALAALDSVTEESEMVLNLRKSIEEQRSKYLVYTLRYVHDCTVWLAEVEKAISQNKAWLLYSQNTMPELRNPYRIQRIAYAAIDSDSDEYRVLEEWTLFPEQPVQQEYYSVIWHSEIIKRKFSHIVYQDEPVQVTPQTAPVGAAKQLFFTMPYKGENVTVSIYAHPAVDAEQVRETLMSGMIEIPKAPERPHEIEIREEELLKIERGEYSEEDFAGG